MLDKVIIAIDNYFAIIINSFHFKLGYGFKLSKNSNIQDFLACLSNFPDQKIRIEHFDLKGTIEDFFSLLSVIV